MANAVTRINYQRCTRQMTVWSQKKAMRSRIYGIGKESVRKRPFLLLATEFLLGIVCVREQLPAWGVLAVLLLVYTTPWKERGMRKVLFAAGLPGMFLLGMLQMQR